jgi:hypothetical protein
MCRYAYHHYRPHLACFCCRKLYRPLETGTLASAPRVHRCPECREPMADMGLDFKAPRQRDAKQWRKAHLLYLHGITFHSCGCGGCGGPGDRPKTLRAAREYVRLRWRTVSPR